MGIFISLFNDFRSGTVNLSCGKWTFECDVKHNMYDWGRRFWYERSPREYHYFYFDFYVPLYWLGLKFSLHTGLQENAPKTKKES